MRGKFKITMTITITAGLLATFFFPRSDYGAPVTAPVAPLTEAALRGWRQTEDGWAYYGQNGGRAVNTWVPSADGSTAYYLDENGIMVTGRLVTLGDDISYVDGTGAQARDCWVALDNKGLCDKPVETVYYYFNSKGKAFRDTRRQINGKTYFFDNEGHMLSDWHEEDGGFYYLGTEHEGWAHTGWQLLTPEGENGFGQWFYFRPESGRAYRGKKKIGDFYYYFDEGTAAMQEGWLEREDNLHAYYEPETGKLLTGWVYCEGPENGEEGWYYLNSDGIPFNERGKDSDSIYLGGSYNAALCTLMTRPSMRTWLLKPYMATPTCLMKTAKGWQACFSCGMLKIQGVRILRHT